MYNQIPIFYKKVHSVMSETLTLCHHTALSCHITELLARHLLK